MSPGVHKNPEAIRSSVIGELGVIIVVLVDMNYDEWCRCYLRSIPGVETHLWRIMFGCWLRTHWITNYRKPCMTNNGKRNTRVEVNANAFASNSVAKYGIQQGYLARIAQITNSWTKRKGLDYRRSCFAGISRGPEYALNSSDVLFLATW